MSVTLPVLNRPHVDRIAFSIIAIHFAHFDPEKCDPRTRTRPLPIMGRGVVWPSWRLPKMSACADSTVLGFDSRGGLLSDENNASKHPYREHIHALYIPGRSGFTYNSGHFALSRKGCQWRLRSLSEGLLVGDRRDSLRAAFRYSPVVLYRLLL